MSFPDVIAHAGEIAETHHASAKGREVYTMQTHLRMSYRRSPD
jgi:hypothetical protein